ncbi:hypothetical protein M4D79_26685 [Mycolicibacterium novocastrense]|nr:hypothetical protein M4D79_26685 [Mycolicibacterium novocastrense]
MSVLTFLFTDIEGSTRRWEADAEAMRCALADHDETMRRTVESHGGWLFKHTGDGVCAVSLGRIATMRGNPLEACGFLAQAIRNYFDSGSFYMMTAPVLCSLPLLCRLGDHEAAATMAGFAAESDASSTYPEIGDTVTTLRETLGRERYESLSRQGRSMSNAALAAYALETIDRVERSARTTTDT